VLGDRRPVDVLVRDAQGREVVGAKVRWTIATPSVLDARLGSSTAASLSSIDALSSSDIVQLSSRHAGTTQIAVSIVAELIAVKHGKGAEASVAAPSMRWEGALKR